MLLQDGGAKLDSDITGSKERQGSASSRRAKLSKSVTFPEKDPSLLSNVSKKDSPRNVAQKGLPRPTQVKAAAKADYDELTMLDSASSLDGSEYSNASLAEAAEAFQLPTNGLLYCVQRREAGQSDVLVKADEQAAWRSASLAECKQCIEFLHGLMVKLQQAAAEEAVRAEEPAAKGRQLSRPKLKPQMADSSSLFVVNGKSVNPLEQEDELDESDARPPSAPLRLGNKSSLPPLVQKVGNRGVQMMKKVKSRQLEHELNFRLQNMSDK